MAAEAIAALSAMTSITPVIGVDFGSDSCRCVIADAFTGEELASAVAAFPRWAAGQYCDPVRRIFRQHPLDHLEALTQAVRGALSQVAPAVRAGVRGLSIATTGSTSAPVDTDGRPLALQPAFADNPNAMFLMWKDHSATLEAEQITATARGWGGVDYTAHIGGVYSAEWYWANLLWVFRHDARVRQATASWVEHCDWLPAELTGTTAPAQLRRSRCAAGHKAMWNERHGGLPSQAFLSRLDPLLDGIRERLYERTWTAETPIGTLTPAWAERLGLPGDVTVGVGAFDAHMGAVGAGIRHHTLVKIMGTSTCDIVLAPTEELADRVVEGICGQVDGSVMAGAIGLEAGQSAVGDAFAWFARVLEWPLQDGEAREALRAELLPRRRTGAAGRARRGRARLAQRAPHALCRPDAARRAVRAVAGQLGAAALPRAGRGHGLRREGDRRPLHRVGRAHRRGARDRRRGAQVGAADADPGRCVRPAHPRGEVGAGGGAGRRHVRGGRMRAACRHSRRAAGHGLRLRPGLRAAAGGGRSLSFTIPALSGDGRLGARDEAGEGGP
jgi:ribulose kinase